MKFGRMKSYVLIGMLVFCIGGSVHAYEPSLYEAERLQTAEKLLWSVPENTQKIIEQKLMNHHDNVQDERKNFCVQYLLYQLHMIAKASELTATTSARIPGLISKVIDDQTFIVQINRKEQIKTLHAG